jgi:predicted ATPase
VLSESFESVVANARPALVLVSGAPGVGKSKLVAELHPLLAPHRGMFGGGKFDQFTRDIPYTALAQCVLVLVRQLLAKPESELSEWRRALLEALGSNGQLIVDLVPELKSIIGPQPPVSEIPSRDARGLSIRSFFSSMTFSGPTTRRWSFSSI